MSRVVLPYPPAAARLAALGASAFDAGETPWTATDFEHTGWPPAGAILADEAMEAALIVLQFAADEAEILNLGVVPARRREGLATALLTSAEDLARELGATRLFLEVAVDNVPARALYERTGYEHVGQRPAYYLRTDGRRVDALVLRKGI